MAKLLSETPRAKWLRIYEEIANRISKLLVYMNNQAHTHIPFICQHMSTLMHILIHAIFQTETVAR